MTYRKTNGTFSKLLYLIFLIAMTSSCGQNESGSSLPKFKSKESIPLILTDLQANNRGVTQDDFVDALKILTKGGVIVDPLASPMLVKESSPYWEENLKDWDAVRMVNKAKTREALAAYSERHSAYFYTPLKSACKWFEDADSEGMVLASLERAKWYATGAVCVAKDDEKASNRFLVAAKEGDMSAQRTMGYRYKKGLGVKQDVRESNYWFQKAAAQGDMDSRMLLGTVSDGEVLLDISKRVSRNK